MLMMPSNFLLLDEPTIHLDMRAKDVLLTSLEEFTGTVVFVSHDRYFIDKLATKVFEVADGSVRLFSGNYEEYLRHKADLPVPAAVQVRAETNRTQHRERPAAAPPAPAPAIDKNVDKNDKQRRLNPIKLKQMKDRQRAIEDEITRLEVEIADFEQALSNYQTPQQSIDIASLLESRREDMKGLLAEWEDVSGTIEANR